MKRKYMWIKSRSGLGLVMALLTYRGQRPIYTLVRTGLRTEYKVRAVREAKDDEIVSYLSKAKD